MVDRVVAALRARIGRRFDVVTQEVAVGPLRFAFTRVRDPDAVLDRVAASNGTAMPYWAELWDSAEGMGRYLAETYTGHRGEAMERKTVLDLGCGMGLAGAVAARLGGDVLLADIETDALLFARLNACCPQGRARVRKVDWQKDKLGEHFDLILGADIVYERSQWAFLEPFWREHLREGGTVLLGEPGRQTGEEFVPWVSARGWGVARVAVAAPKKVVHVLELRRQPGG